MSEWGSAISVLIRVAFQVCGFQKNAPGRSKQKPPGFFCGFLRVFAVFLRVRVRSRKIMRSCLIILVNMLVFIMSTLNLLCTLIFGYLICCSHLFCIIIVFPVRRIIPHVFWKEPLLKYPRNHLFYFVFLLEQGFHFLLIVTIPVSK